MIRITVRPQMDELRKRLESTKKLPALVNEFGKRFFGTNGPIMQRQVFRFCCSMVLFALKFSVLQWFAFVFVVALILVRVSSWLP